MAVGLLQEITRTDLAWVVQSVNKEIAPADQPPDYRWHNHGPKGNGSLEVVVDVDVIDVGVAVYVMVGGIGDCGCRYRRRRWCGCC